MNPISYHIPRVAHQAPSFGKDPYKSRGSIPDFNVVLPKDTPDVMVSTVGFSLGASQVTETVQQRLAQLQLNGIYIPGEIPTLGAQIRPNPTDRMGYYDRWSLAHAAVTTTTLNARIAMTPNGQLWRKMTPADLPS